ncbi:MAG TPA: hypothetical protein VG204_17380 [Terriglobia bacterium]|nr:hypothetical protein [Terriglobia bacterium]
MCEAAADVAQPWPLKIVLDYLLQSKRPPPWMAVPLRWIGPDKLAVLNFAVLVIHHALDPARIKR